MRRAACIVAGAAGIALHAALLLGLGAPLPDAARVVLALLVLVLLPGAAFVAMGAVPPGGMWLAPGWALGFGVAWLGGLVLLTRALELPFTVLATWSLVTSALLWGLAAWRGGRGPVPGAVVSTPPGWPSRSRVALAALALAAAAGAWHAGRLGTPLGISTDSPDHIGTIRRMVASGDAFPRDAFFRDAGAAGADPRKGLWHPQVALVAHLSGVDPLVTWRFLPLCLVPLFVLNVAVFGFLLRGPPGAAVAGWAYLITYGGSLAEQYVREAVFATKLGDQLALATAAAVLADLRWPARRLRAAAVGLALGALAAHVYYAIQFAMAFTALGVGLLVLERGFGIRARRLAGTAVALGLTGLPYLLWRWAQSYAPRNVIHTETQGLMWLADRVPVVSFGVLWDWLGNAWVLFPLAAWWLWRAGRRDPAALYLISTPVAVALVIFDPPVVSLLAGRLAYLLMRMVWMLPLAPLLAWMLVGLWAEIRHGHRRLAAALTMVAALAFLWPVLLDAARTLADPAPISAQERRGSAAPWADALGWMKEHLPPGTVVLSDPATSYSVPMFTGLYVMTLSDQHSSPNDPFALTRILDARDALEPFATWDRTRDVVTRYDVDVVALNNRFPEPPPLDYWRPTPEWFMAARARLDAAPAAFEPLYDTGDFVVYRVHRPALDTLAIPAPLRPFVEHWRPDTGPPCESVDPGLPALCGFRLLGHEAGHGDTLHAIAYWRAVAPLRPASYFVALRFDRPLPGGFRPPTAVAKPARKVLERLRGERYRFRVDHLPVGGAYGLDLWRPDEMVRDSFAFVVPGDVATGEYRVRIRMVTQPHYPNLHLRDYFVEDDYLSGLEVGTLVVRNRSGSGGS